MRNHAPALAILEPRPKLGVGGDSNPIERDSGRVSQPIEDIGQLGVFGRAVGVDDVPERWGLRRRRFRVEA